MDQAEGVEADLIQDDEVTLNPEDNNSRSEENALMSDKEQLQMEEDLDMNSKSQEKPVQVMDKDIVDIPQLDSQDTMEDSNVMEWDEVTGDTSEAHKKSIGEKRCSSSVDSSEECETSSMAVVIMEELPSHSEDSNNDNTALGKETNESQEFEKEESVNPLGNLSEQEKTNKESESDVLEVIAVQMNSIGESDSAEIGTSSKTNEESTSSEIQSDKSMALEQESPGEGSRDLNTSKDVKDGDTGSEAVMAEIIVESSKKKLDEGEDIVELPIQKQPTMIVDLEDEDEVIDKSQRESPPQIDENELSLGDDKTTTSEGKRIKLRSLASLVDISDGDNVSSNPAESSCHKDIPAIGEIVEHGVIIGSDEMDGLHLRISNVVGGEDCITGLTVDEDRDAFSSIQISSVTTLIEPMSPEDPNKVNDKSENGEVGEGSGESSGQTCTVEGEDRTSDSVSEAENKRPEVVDRDTSTVMISKDSGKSSSGSKETSSQEKEKSFQDKESKSSDEKDSEAGIPKLGHRNAASVSILNIIFIFAFHMTSVTCIEHIIVTS